jgi:hypothetical protein
MGLPVGGETEEGLDSPSWGRELMAEGWAGGRYYLYM